MDDDDELPTLSRRRLGPLASGPPSPELSDAQTTPTASSVMKTPVLASAAGSSKSRSPSFTKKFLRRPNAKRSSSLDSTMALPAAVSGPVPASPSSPNLPSGASTPALSASSSGAVTPGGRPAPSASKARFRKSWGAKNTDFNFSAGNDIVGIVLLEIKGAVDLPKLKNSECALCMRSGFC